MMKTSGLCLFLITKNMTQQFKSGNIGSLNQGCFHTIYEANIILTSY